MHDHKHKIALVMSLLLVACSHSPVQPPSRGHLQQSDAAAPADPTIPQPVQSSAALPRPKPAPKVETYSVVVQNVSAQELLFALARDAKLNVDVHPGINGTVTLNAIDQTLQQLLTRISKQVDMRWELDGPNLIVTPDTPYLRTYTVDYVNMARDTSVSTSTNSQVNSGTSSGSGSSSGSNGNNSTTKIDNTSKNHFWETLGANLKDILRETDKILPEGSSDTIIERQDETSSNGPVAASSKSAAATSTNASANSTQNGATTIHRTTFREAASVIVNPESGVVTVRATSRQHEKIVDFLDSVMSSARRQVMVEATIVQVNLNDGYQQGIDWARIRADGSGFSVITPVPKNGLTSIATATFAPTSNPGSLSSITNAVFSRVDNSNPLNLAQAVTLLNNFGTVKVLSSPKLSVLNNQTAVLKVVKNIVYFTIVSNVAAGSTGAAQTATTATPQTVSVGLVMSVTPQIAADHSIILNVRPSISSLLTPVADPTNAANQIPQIQTSEIESVMRLNDGDIGVLGGLMQESGDYETNKIPGVGDIPLLGELFTSRNNAKTKSELVIFLRPVVVENPSISGDFRNLKDYLPDSNFNKKPAHAEFLPSLGNQTTEAGH